MSLFWLFFGAGFQLNTDSGLLGTATQGRVSVDRAQDGRVAVAWEDLRNGNWDIYYSVYQADGTPIIEDIRANTDSTLEDQRNPAVSFAPDGRFVIAWEDYAGDQPKIRFHLFDHDGNGLFRTFDADDRYQDAKQTNPKAAWMGSVLWLVWENERLSSKKIFLRLFHDNGAPASFVIDVNGQDSHPLSPCNPSLATGDSTGFIAWQSLNQGTWDVWYNVFYHNGDRVSVNSMSVEMGDGHQMLPAVSTAGQGFAVFYISTETGPELHARAYTALGSVLTSITTLATESDTPTSLAAKTNNDTMEIAWLTQGEIRFLLCNDSLHLLSGPDRLDDSPDSVRFFGIASNSNAPTAFWVDARRTDPDVYTTAGLMANAEQPRQITPSVATIGQRALAVWTDYRNDTGTGNNPDVFGRIFTPAGPIGPDFSVPTTASGVQAYPAASSTGDSFVVVWQDERDGLYQIYRRFLDTTGTGLGPDARLLPVSTQQSKPACAGWDSGFITVWEQMNTSWQIVGLMSPSGTQITVSEPGNVSDPKVAALADGRFCVVWLQAGQAFYRTFAQDGTPACPATAISPSSQSVFNVSVAAGDSLFTVAWEAIQNIYARTIRPDGSYASDTVRPASWQARQHRPSVACSGDSILVAWDGYLVYPNIFIRQFQTTVDNPSSGFAGLEQGSGLPMQCSNTSLAGTPTGVAAAWVDYRSSKGPDIFADWIAWDLPAVHEAQSTSGGRLIEVMQNPVARRLRLRVFFRRGLLRVYDPAGRLVKTWSVSGPGSLYLDVSGLVPGVYTILGPERARAAFSVVR